MPIKSRYPERERDCNRLIEHSLLVFWSAGGGRSREIRGEERERGREGS